MIPFSRLPSESSHPSEIGKSLSEAFSNVSSVRDALPEQYRVHFDELRDGILAFCHEFNIPVETLRSKEDFGKQLASKKISQERLAQAVSLFVCLEYFVVNGEPFKETLPEHLREIEQLYHLTEQYNAQVELLKRIGILKEGVITGIDDNKYPIPTLEHIASRLLEREKELSTKRDQGFTKLLLVPFGMSLDTLRETFKTFLLSYKQTHPDFDLNINAPLWWHSDSYFRADTGDSPELVYFPKSFDKIHHQGKTKLQILGEQVLDTDSLFPGWKIHLFQPSNPRDLDSPGFSSISRHRQGEIHGEEILRHDIEAGKSPKDYLTFLQQVQKDTESPYGGESGLIPEDWILAFMTHLEETGKPLDDYLNKTDNIAYLIGAFFRSFGCVPFMDWDNGVLRARLGMRAPDNQSEAVGVRTSVII